MKKILEKAKSLGLLARDKVLDAKDLVVSRLRPNKEMEKQLNELGQLLTEANTRTELDELARDLKSTEMLINSIRNRVLKMKAEI